MGFQDASERRPPAGQGIRVLRIRRPREKVAPETGQVRDERIRAAPVAGRLLAQARPKALLPGQQQRPPEQAALEDRPRGHTPPRIGAGSGRDGRAQQHGGLAVELAQHLCGRPAAARAPFVEPIKEIDEITLAAQGREVAQGRQQRPALRPARQRPSVTGRIEMPGCPVEAEQHARVERLHDRRQFGAGLDQILEDRHEAGLGQEIDVGREVGGRGEVVQDRPQACAGDQRFFENEGNGFDPAPSRVLCHLAAMRYGVDAGMRQAADQSDQRRCQPRAGQAARWPPRPVVAEQGVVEEASAVEAAGRRQRSGRHRATVPRGAAVQDGVQPRAQDTRAIAIDHRAIQGRWTGPVGLQQVVDVQPGAHDRHHHPFHRRARSYGSDDQLSATASIAARAASGSSR